MATIVVVRIGPVALRPGRARPRLDELARILAGPVGIEEVTTIDALGDILASRVIAAIAADAPPPGEPEHVVALAGRRPVLQPRWETRRSQHGDTIQRFAGYARPVEGRLADLADGELA